MNLSDMSGCQQSGVNHATRLRQLGVMGTPSKNLVSIVSPTPDRSPVHLDLSLMSQTARPCAINSLDLSRTGIVFPSLYNAICSQDDVPGPVRASDGFAGDGSLPTTLDSLHARISTGVGTEKDCSPRPSSTKVIRDHDKYPPHMSVPHEVSVSCCSPTCRDKFTQALSSCKHAVPVSVFVDTETDDNADKHIVIPTGTLILWNALCFRKICLPRMLDILHFPCVSCTELCRCVRVFVCVCLCACVTGGGNC